MKSSLDSWQLRLRMGLKALRKNLPKFLLTILVLLVVVATFLGPAISVLLAR